MDYSSKDGKSNAIMIYVIICSIIEVLVYLYAPDPVNLIFITVIKMWFMIVLAIFFVVIHKPVCDWIATFRFNKPEKQLEDKQIKWEEFKKTPIFKSLPEKNIHNFVLKLHDYDLSIDGAYAFVFQFNRKSDPAISAHPEEIYVASVNPYKGEMLNPSVMRRKNYEDPMVNEEDIRRVILYNSRRKRSLTELLGDHPELFEDWDMNPKDIIPLLGQQGE